MSGLTRALATTLDRNLDYEEDWMPTADATAILADPTFREALTREVAEAVLAERLTDGTNLIAEQFAAAIVARLLGAAR